MKVIHRGVEIDVEIELRTGLTVHNQDGTSYVQVHVVPKIPPFDGGPGGGEPLPVADAA